MTATQTREPARTPADAQSAGSRQTTADLRDFIALVIIWLMFAATVGIIAALMAHAHRDPTWTLGVLALSWQIARIHILPTMKRGGRR